MRKTKIVCTIGPSSEAPEMLRKLIAAGMNVARLNFSHGDFEEHGSRIRNIRKVAAELNKTVAILLDTKGPEIRIGKLKEEPIELIQDEKIILTTEEILGDLQRISVTYDRLPEDVQVGSTILLDDGLIGLRVTDVRGNDIECLIVNGGTLKSKKGVNVPGVRISLPGITEKDAADIRFGIEQGVDFIAASFVRKASDVLEIRELLEKHNATSIQIISKIENQEGVDNLDEILEVSDGLMVARGDLGVELPAHEVPLIQKKLVNRAKTARIPVIIATQMMETMITSLTPTRAEVNDVANSVMDGADAVMLSGETSVGNYPVQVIEKMTQIIEAVEDSPLIQVPQNTPQVRTKRFITKSICHHAAMMANVIKAKAICTLTNSGYTAFQISAWRPQSHILVFTSNQRILTQLSLLWGVNSFFYDKFVSTDDTVVDVNKKAKEHGYVQKGDMLINLAAMPVTDKGMVNTLRVSEID